MCDTFTFLNSKYSWVNHEVLSSRIWQKLYVYYQIYNEGYSKSFMPLQQCQNGLVAADNVLSSSFLFQNAPTPTFFLKNPPTCFPSSRCAIEWQHQCRINQVHEQRMQRLQSLNNCSLVSVIWDWVVHFVARLLKVSSVVNPFCTKSLCSNNT